MKTTVIYHSADYDGIFCREIARKFLPDAELIGWDFGQPKVTLGEFDLLYILDLPPDCAEPFDLNHCIWIDHHKSAIEKWPKDIPGYRIDGVAACRLAWQWFQQRTPDNPTPAIGVEWPVKEDFIDRIVVEPLAVRLAGEYDVWDHRGDGDLEFQFGLDAQKEIIWEDLLELYPVDVDAKQTAEDIIGDGESAMRCYSKRDADIMRSRSFTMKWEGLKWLCLNTARCNSNTFAARDVPETGHDALMGFYFNGRVWTVSLYHAKHRTELDLSTIAVKHGGGGHRGACGFTCQKPPCLA